MDFIHSPAAGQVPRPRFPHAPLTPYQAAVKLAEKILDWDLLPYECDKLAVYYLLLVCPPEDVPPLEEDLPTWVMEFLARAAESDEYQRLSPFAA